jgi:hypothetical protein
MPFKPALPETGSRHLEVDVAYNNFLFSNTSDASRA